MLVSICSPDLYAMLLKLGVSILLELDPILLVLLNEA